jgi:pimeloyl-ACP methyl ester carboxylesterase
VLLHEGLGCVAMWRELPAQLAAATGLDVVAYSRAGYGRSSPVPAAARPLDYLRVGGVRELAALLATLALDDVLLVGHSDGASIALAYAAAVGRPPVSSAPPTLGPPSSSAPPALGPPSSSAPPALGPPLSSAPFPFGPPASSAPFPLGPPASSTPPALGSSASTPAPPASRPPASSASPAPTQPPAPAPAAAPGPAPTPTPRLRGVAAIAPHTFIEELSLAQIRVARQQYQRGALAAGLARYHGENVEGAFWGWNAMWLDPAFTVSDLEAELPRISIPVLALQGRQDEYGSLRQLAIIAARSGGPVEQLVLEDCRHSPHRDQPAATLAALAAFARRLC